jgi:apolipoprotein N-acyltransferase
MKQFKTYQLFSLSLLSAFLLAFGWFPNGLIPLLFVAFVPLLMVEQIIFLNPEKYKSLTLFACAYLTFFTWNILTTWWLKNASWGGAAMAITCNALLMTIVFLLFHSVKKRVAEKWGMLVFVCFWLTFEFLHMDWDLTWTWLTLGNAFADVHNWIQWYEYTGVFGGSFWVLGINVFIFKIVSDIIFHQKKFETKELQKKGVWLLAFIAFPILVSYTIRAFPREFKEHSNVVVIQPNIDPYNEKFVAGYEEQLQKMLLLASPKVDSLTDYLIFPETALTENLWETELDQSTSLQMLQQFLKPFPKLKIIIGASTAKVYQPGEELSPTARKFRNSEEYYDAYNTAFQLDNVRPLQIYHKSKLVPGVEKMPFPFIFKHLEGLAIDLGGATGSLATQAERSVFVSAASDVKVAPVVCYESVYGEYVTGYIKNGASFISIITNDGWWGDTPGYKQHLKYGRLRAIETRRYIARSANTGISCIIDDNGDINEATTWWTPAVIKSKVGLSNELTFYTRYGDFIARIAMYLSFTLIIYSWLLRFKILRKP